MRFAALGRTQWLYDSIRKAVAKGHEPVIIGTSPAAPEYSIKEDHFARLAEELGCVYFCDSAINQPHYLEMIRRSRAEVAISVNWLTLIAQNLIDQFKYGVINAHAGDLPRFRGNAVPNWAILAGETKVVLTLHQMTLDLDAGPILLQREYPLAPDTYVRDIYRFLSDNIPTMFTNVLDGLAAGTIVPRAQSKDLSLSLRCFPRLPEDSEIDWTFSAEDLARLVRASAEPFSGAYTFLDSEKLVVWRAHAEQLSYPVLGKPGQVIQLRSESGQAAVLATDGVFVLEEIETVSGSRGRPTDFIKSTRVRLGLNLSKELGAIEHRVAQLEKKLEQLTSEGDETE